jgi:hypothetical protein
MKKLISLLFIMDTFQILILLTIILILLVILLLLFYKHQEKFIVNPILFTGNYNEEDIQKMRDYRDCQGVRNKEHCILKQKPFTKHLKISRMPYKKYVNYQLTRRASDLLPQYKEPRPHF